MRESRFYLTSALLLVVGLVSLGSKWIGTAGINAGYPISAWSVSFSGSVSGWPAMIGVIAIVSSVILFLAAVLHSLFAPPHL